MAAPVFRLDGGFSEAVHFTLYVHYVKFGSPFANIRPSYGSPGAFISPFTSLICSSHRSSHLFWHLKESSFRFRTSLTVEATADTAGASAPSNTEEHLRMISSRTTSALSTVESQEVEVKLLTALKNRKTEDAWRLYEVLVRRGIFPSEVCLSRLVAQLSHKGTSSSLSRAQKVLVYLEKVGQLNSLDADSLGLLVMASARSGAARYALSILRIMFQIEMCPPVKVWSAVVSRLGKHPDDAHLAVELFEEICSLLGLDVIKGGAEGKSKGGDEKVGLESNHESSVVQQTTHWASGKDVLPDIAAFNAALNACATVGLMQPADHFLEQMAFCGIRPDVITFNILIKLLAKANEGDQLLNVLQDMEDAGVEPDLSTFNSLVASFVSLGQINDAEHIVQSMQKGALQSELKESAGPNLVTRPKPAHVTRIMKRVLQGVDRVTQQVMSTEESRSVVEQSSEQLKSTWVCKVKPDVRTYTTLMKGYVQKNRLKDAVQVLLAMQSQNEARSQPNEVTYTTVISACVDIGLIDEARSVLCEMATLKLPANLMTYNIILKGYCNVSELSRAYEVVDDMRKAGLSPDVVSYNTLINSCIKRYDSLGALELFREMRKAKIAPTEVSYTTLMKAFAKNHQPSFAAEVFKEMQLLGWMRVDVIAWNVLIDSYCVSGLMMEAKESFAKMKEQGFHPTVATYTSLAKGFSLASHPGEVLVLWKEIQERIIAKEGDGVEPFEPDGGLLDSLVDTCLRAGFFQRALEMVACMEAHGILADKIKLKRMFIELHSNLYTGKNVSPQKVAKTNERRSAVDAFKFWLGLPNAYYQSDWKP